MAKYFQKREEESMYNYNEKHLSNAYDACNHIVRQCMIKL